MQDKHLPQVSKDVQIVPKWMPILLGIIAPLLFSTQALLMKHLSKTKFIVTKSEHIISETPLIETNLKLLEQSQQEKVKIVK